MIINKSTTENLYGAQGRLTVSATIVEGKLQQVVLVENGSGSREYFRFNSLRELDNGVDILTSMRNRLLSEEVR